MKKITVLIFLFAVIISCHAQNQDSIRTIINKMSLEIPVLSTESSEVPNFKTLVISRNYAWKFNTSDKNINSSNIEEPGEFVMQGFKVETGKAATLSRSFDYFTPAHALSFKKANSLKVIII